MSNSAFAALTAVCILLLSGTVIAAAVLRNSFIRKEHERLTAVELQAVEESAALLIQRLQEHASEASAAIDVRLREIRILLELADRKLEELRSAAMHVSSQTPNAGFVNEPARPATAALSADVERILVAARAGLGAADIARETGIDRASIGLVLSLFGPGPQ